MTTRSEVLNAKGRGRAMRWTSAWWFSGEYAIVAESSRKFAVSVRDAFGERTTIGYRPTLTAAKQLAQLHKEEKT
jgi:hypothetical protein